MGVVRSRTESLREWHTHNARWHYGTWEVNSKHILSTYYELGTALVAGIHLVDQS